MSELPIALIVIIVTFAAMAILIRMIFAYGDGRWDYVPARYGVRRARSNDHYTGILRSLYEIGYETAAKNDKVASERNAERDTPAR